jgi:hypothetical protein
MIKLRFIMAIAIASYHRESPYLCFGFQTIFVFCGLVILCGIVNQHRLAAERNPLLLDSRPYSTFIFLKDVTNIVLYHQLSG